MHRLLLALAVLIGIGGGLGFDSQRAAAARDATPEAAPEVVIVDAVPKYFAVEITRDVPEPPAVLVLLRLTLEPGAVRTFPARRVSAPLILVEAGTMTATTEAPLTINRGQPGGEREEIAAGSDLTAGVGDFFIGATGAVEEARNEGDEPLILLVLLIDPAPDGVPAAATAELPAGVTGDLLAVARSEAIPPAPALLELIRFTFAPAGTSSCRRPAPPRRSSSLNRER